MIYFYLAIVLDFGYSEAAAGVIPLFGVVVYEFSSDFGMVSIFFIAPIILSFAKSLNFLCFSTFLIGFLSKSITIVFFSFGFLGIL